MAGKTSFVGFVATILLGCLSISAFGAQPQHPFAPKAQFIGLDGGHVALDQFRGSVVVMNFWTTSCSICLAETSSLEALHRQYGPQGLRVLGIALENDPEKVRLVSQQHSLTYPIAIGGEDLEEHFGIEGFPVTLVIGRDGRIYSQHTGATSADALRSEIAQLLPAADSEVIDFRASPGAEPASLPTPGMSNPELPGVDVSGLSESQIAELKRQLTAQPCPCGCGRSALECRSRHSSCVQSKNLARQAVEKMRGQMI
jgi:peroxiredoxin